VTRTPSRILLGVSSLAAFEASTLLFDRLEPRVHAQIKETPVVVVNPKNMLLRIELLQVGIVSIGETKAEAGSEQIRRARVELYVEEMKLQMKGSALG